MKPEKTVDDDREPLLYPTLAGQVAVAADEARLHEQTSGAIVSERMWEGHLLQCCGSCDATGWLSCIVSRWLPCVAFGSNARRGLRSSAWLHGLLFLTLFGLAYWVAASALAAASHNVLATCNGPLPHPPHEHPHPHPGHNEPHPAHPPQHPPHPPIVDVWGPEGVLGRFLPWLHPHHPPHDAPHHLPHPHPHPEDVDDDDEDDKAVFVSWGTFENSNAKHQVDEHESDGSDGDHHHKHGDKEGKHKAEKHKKVKKEKKGDRKILPGATLDLDLVKLEQQPEEQPRQLQAFEFSRSDGQPQPRPEDFQATPECRQAVGLYLGAWIAVIASFLVAVHYAARRRTMLRMKFGIAGSRMSDFCTWFWCGSCALCQETRTLWVNQVHEGVWHGPTKIGYTAVPTLPAPTNQAPPSQFMTTGV